MAKTSRARITGPGSIYNRNPKKGEIQIDFDPSPDGFVTEARAGKKRLKVVIAPESSDMAPIELSGLPKCWRMMLTGVAMDKARLADLEFLLTEGRTVHVTMEYVPDEKLFAEDGDAGASEPR